uniref:Uncharacterized protein n=1 Tax=Romanomermis culicivorax TaxID=13658 RepID=A0A915KW81_ROMCU
MDVLHVIHVHRINQFFTIIFADEDLQNVSFGVEVCNNGILAKYSTETDYSLYWVQDMRLSLLGDPCRLFCTNQRKKGNYV